MALLPIGTYYGSTYEYLLLATYEGYLPHDQRLVALVDDDALPSEPLERDALVGSLEALGAQQLEGRRIASCEERCLAALSAYYVSR